MEPDIVVSLVIKVQVENVKGIKLIILNEETRKIIDLIVEISVW